jgi:hypothetical protein
LEPFRLRTLIVVLLFVLAILLAIWRPLVEWLLLLPAPTYGLVVGAAILSASLRWRDWWDREKAASREFARTATGISYLRGGASLLGRSLPFLIGLFGYIKDTQDGFSWGAYGELVGFSVTSILLLTGLEQWAKGPPDVHADSFRRGVRQTFERWVRAAGSSNVGLADVYCFQNGQTKTLEFIVNNSLSAIYHLVTEAFPTEATGRVMVNLMLPCDGGKNLVVAYASGNWPDRRIDGKRVNLEAEKNALYEAARTFDDRKFRYEPNIAAKRNSAWKHKKYKAIMNWPVLSGSDQAALGVVNVDSELPHGFDDNDSPGTRESIVEVCAPFVRAIALVLPLVREGDYTPS